MAPSSFLTGAGGGLTGAGGALLGAPGLEPDLTFAEWLARPAASRVVRQSILVPQELTDWEEDRTGVDKHDFLRFDQADVVAGGLGRKLRRVERDSEDLTERGSVWAVEQDGGWHHSRSRYDIRASVLETVRAAWNFACDADEIGDSIASTSDWYVTEDHGLTLAGASGSVVYGAGLLPADPDGRSAVFSGTDKYFTVDTAIALSGEWFVSGIIEPTAHANGEYGAICANTAGTVGIFVLGQADGSLRLLFRSAGGESIHTAPLYPGSGVRYHVEVKCEGVGSPLRIGIVPLFSDRAAAIESFATAGANFTINRVGRGATEQYHGAIGKLVACDAADDNLEALYAAAISMEQDGRIYVDADRPAVTLAWFQLGMSTEAIDELPDDTPWPEPRILDGVPPVTSQVDDPLFGVSSASGSTVQYANGDGLFDATNYLWHRATVAHYFGGHELPADEWQAMSFLRATRALAVDDAVAALAVSDHADVFARQVVTRTFGDWWAAGLGTPDEMPESSKARWMPVLFGSVANVSPIPIWQSTTLTLDITAGTSTTVFTVNQRAHAHRFADGQTVIVRRAANGDADETRVIASVVPIAGGTLATVTLTVALGGTPANGDDIRGTISGIGEERFGTVDDDDAEFLVEISAVRAVSKATGAVTELVENTDWSNDNTFLTYGGLRTFNGYFSDAFDLFCDITTTLTPALNVGSDGTVIETSGDAIYNLLYRVQGGELGGDDLDDVRGRAPQPIGLYLREPTRMGDVLTRLQAPTLRAYPELDESAAAESLIWDVDALGEATTTHATDETVHLEDSDLTVDGWRGEDPEQVPLWKAAIEFGETDRFGVQSATHEDVAVTHRHGAVSTRTIQTALTRRADAQDAARLIQFLYARPWHAFGFRENGMRLMAEEAGNLIRLTRERAPTASGAYSAALMTITKLALGLSPAGAAGALHDTYGLAEELATLLAATPEELTFYLTDHATADPYPTDCRLLALGTEPAGSEAQIDPGEFDSDGPGNTDAGQWRPGDAIASTTLATELSDIPGGTIEPAGWVMHGEHLRFNAQTVTAHLRLEATQGSGETCRAFLRGTVMKADGGVWTPSGQMFATNIVGGSGSGDQDGWTASVGTISPTSTPTTHTVTFANLVARTLAPDEKLLWELGFGAASNTNDRTLRLLYNNAHTRLVFPSVECLTVRAALQRLMLAAWGERLAAA